MKNESKNINNKNCYVVKIIVIGDQSVGKTNILNRFVKGQFSEEYAITIGMDFLTCNLELDDKIFKLRLWDTAGSERFRSVTKGYYSNSCCAIIVYDITDENSFKSVKDWIEDCQTYASKYINLVLVGNKIDLEQERKISKEDGLELATEYGMEFFEASAKTGKNIEDIFSRICKIVDKKIDEGKYDFDDPSNGVSISEIDEGMQINKSISLLGKNINKNNTDQKKGCC